MRLRPARAGQNPPASLIAETDPRSPASEAYRALRTNIQFAGLDQPCRCIGIGSPIERQVNQHIRVEQDDHR